MGWRVWFISLWLSHLVTAGGKLPPTTCPVHVPCSEHAPVFESAVSDCNIRGFLNLMSFSTFSFFILYQRLSFVETLGLQFSYIKECTIPLVHYFFFQWIMQRKLFSHYSPPVERRIISSSCGYGFSFSDLSLFLLLFKLICGLLIWIAVFEQSHNVWFLSSAFGTTPNSSLSHRSWRLSFP